MLSESWLIFKILGKTKYKIIPKGYTLNPINRRQPTEDKQSKIRKHRRKPPLRARISRYYKQQVRYLRLQIM